MPQDDLCKPGAFPGLRGGTRLLAGQDLAELERLAAACGATAWGHSGIDPARPPVFGCFAGEVLAAAGTLDRWGDRLLHLGIVTHPGYRGRGYGKAVVSAMTASQSCARCRRSAIFKRRSRALISSLLNG